MKGDMIKREHLGGYIEGGDEATFYPEMWAWLAAHGINSVLDVGCGDGQAIDKFKELGCFVHGIDGLGTGHDAVTIHDYSKGPIPWDKRKSILHHFPSNVGMVWCCEFVEHIEEKYVLNFLDTFTIAPVVLMTHAMPGQEGHHHVNCRPADYWVGAMAAFGFRYDADLTFITKFMAAQNQSPWNHYARSGLAFIRNGSFFPTPIGVDQLTTGLSGSQNIERDVCHSLEVAPADPAVVESRVL